MAYLRVFLFLLLISFLITIIVKYIVLGLFKIKLKEIKFFNKILKKSKIKKDIHNLRKSKH